MWKVHRVSGDPFVGVAGMARAAVAGVEREFAAQEIPKTPQHVGRKAQEVVDATTGRYRLAKCGLAAWSGTATREMLLDQIRQSNLPIGLAVMIDAG